MLSNYQKYLLENKPAPYRQPSKFSNLNNSTENAAKKLLKQFQQQALSADTSMYYAPIAQTNHQLDH